MRNSAVLLGMLMALIIGGVVALRVPAIEDRLFDRAVSDAFNNRAIELFDGDGLKVIFCGTGSPLQSAARAQPCTAIVVGDRFYLVDSGNGSWETLQRLGIPADRLAAVFLTHFHSDHIGGLGEANLNSWVAGRNAPLTVYGPEGVGDVLAGFNKAYAADNRYRTAHHGKAVAEPRSAGLSASEFVSQQSIVVLETGDLKVTAFEVSHDPVSPAVGYRFDYRGRSVVISGDTAHSDNLISVAKDVGLLIHEAQANHMVAKMQDAAARAGVPRYAKIFADIPSYHTSPTVAAEIANEAGANWLVLTHLTPSPDNKIAERIFMRGVSKIRSSNVRLAEDGLIVLLPAAGGVNFEQR